MSSGAELDSVGRSVPLESTLRIGCLSGSGTIAAVWSPAARGVGGLGAIDADPDAERTDRARIATI
ncbi:hypothetical protein [Nocardia callitridis]|uniref:Uncharacterized protein n=1 Tax=Nocardia callitridis TaxID=648753 RepID=A0ABP9K1T4_9NOCA